LRPEIGVKKTGASPERDRIVPVLIGVISQIVECNTGGFISVLLRRNFWRRHRIKGDLLPGYSSVPSNATRDPSDEIAIAVGKISEWVEVPRIK
jgi:hypothetical protein